MKLKYYMRGLGIGIILTTLIFTISGNTKEKLSDQEIIDRAVGLGMVKEDNAQLEKVLEDAKPSVTPKVTPTAAPTPTDKPAPSPTDKPAPTPTSKPKATPTVTAEAEQEKVSRISFTIESGMSSGKVAALLDQVGLIDDANQFNQYIIKEGKASIIKVGTYSLPKGASFDDIVKTITSK